MRQRCSYAGRYKATRAPTCGCKACADIWAARVVNANQAMDTHAKATSIPAGRFVPHPRDLIPLTGVEHDALEAGATHADVRASRKGEPVRTSFDRVYPGMPPALKLST
jgi:hypothetical protein